MVAHNPSRRRITADFDARACWPVPGPRAASAYDDDAHFASLHRRARIATALRAVGAVLAVAGCVALILRRPPPSAGAEPQVDRSVVSAGLQAVEAFVEEPLACDLPLTKESQAGPVVPLTPKPPSGRGRVGAKPSRGEARDTPHKEKKSVSPWVLATVPVAKGSLDAPSVFITTSPPGATVKVNGLLEGKTPVVVDWEPGRRFEVVLSLAGYKRHSIVFVPDSPQGVLRVELAANQP